MFRVPRITERSQVADEHGEIFDSITSSRGRVSGPFSVLLNSPETAGRAAHLGAYLRFDSTLPDDQRGWQLSPQLGNLIAITNGPPTKDSRNKRECGMKLLKLWQTRGR